MTTNEELLPCPFCGSEAEIERYGDARRSTIYNCTDCGCRLETGEEWGHGAAWNRRANPERATNEKLREAVARIVDPRMWRRFDRALRAYADHITPEQRRAWSEYIVTNSLAKADAILALIGTERLALLDEVERLRAGLGLTGGSRPLLCRADEDPVEFAALVAVKRAGTSLELLDEDLSRIGRALTGGRPFDLRDDYDRRANETLKALISATRTALSEGQKS